jgi:alpha-D-xyloside xylohydrolase
MTRQPLEEIRVYPGRDAHFTLFDDDGVSTKAGKTATLNWDDKARRLTATGTLPTGQAPASLLRIMGE